MHSRVFRFEGGEGVINQYKPLGRGKLHQLLENPTCTPIPTVYPLQIRPVFVFCHDKGLRTQVEVVTVVSSPLCCRS